MNSTVNTSLSGRGYIDYAYDSELTTSGDLITYQGYEAVRNALILWLYSLRGERNRLPEWGGYVTRWLFKPISEDTAENIQMSIMMGLREEFSPSLSIEQVSVVPNYNEDCWYIEIRARMTTTREEIHVIENIRRIV